MKNRIWRLSRIAAVMAACAVSCPIGTAVAQTAQQQYVVFYGELAAKPGALFQGAMLLTELARLAGRAPGSLYFAVNSEIGRPNFFSLVEVWKDAASFRNFRAQSNVQGVERSLTPLLLAPLDERDGNFVQ